jgi:uncharacterized lipoprotein YddW (UPF0748 family)
MKYCSTLLLVVLLPFILSAQSTPKREFRAAWIATVSNIDWPSKQGLPSYQQQQEFIAQLDKLKKIGCNAVIVQIRPAADALFPSEFEPWSRFLTGRQGQPPFPYYDPLKFMIEETHKRCMEFHAWFNPYRALTDSKKNPNPPSHVTFQHRDWIISYGGKSYIDPGIPEARNYVTQVIMDVVKRYDVDAVHLDDYFYPYRIAGVEFGDGKSFAKYNSGFTDKGDWRRNNVSVFVSTLNSQIKKEKPYVKLGISPFGIWRNASKDPEGSPTRGGQTCYDDLYADVLLWMRKGWIDYLLPQLYWEHNHRAAAFDILLPWWEAHSYDRHVYYGLGLYRMKEAPNGVWGTSHELLWQIRDIRNKAAYSSQVLYSASILDKINPAVTDSISHTNMYYAFPPPMPWIDTSTPPAPAVKAIPSSQGTLLQWNMPASNKEQVVYAVYRFTNDEQINLGRSDKIINVLRENEFLDARSNKFRKCTYVVTAFDRLWNESRNPVAVSVILDK